jgi:protein TonB
MVAEAPRGFAALVAAIRDASRRRKLAALAIALGLEALIALLLLTLGVKLAGDPDSKEKVATFKSVEFAAPPPPEPEQSQETSEADTPQETTPVTPAPPMRPSPLALNPQPAPEPPPPAPAPPQPQAEPQPSPAPARPKIGARINPNRSYGPADTGNPRSAGDSERVGTAPNGEPLYAARWYREPTDQELAGYLSTANGPGVALIACRTVNGYYVEDCVLLSESPQGSQIGRAVLAAAWQFRVRPARIGGQEQFGSWVRIQITYSVRQKSR